MNKNFISVTVLVLAALAGYLLEANQKSPDPSPQILQITAKEGYKPSSLTARAETPVLLRVKTDNTKDCSEVLVIPKIQYRAKLPETGVTDIRIPPQQAGTTISGTCGMGMFTLNIKFD
jgi:plastocyanin domain-containing protein